MHRSRNGVGVGGGHSTNSSISSIISHTNTHQTNSTNESNSSNTTTPRRRLSRATDRARSRSGSGGGNGSSSRVFELEGDESPLAAEDTSTSAYYQMIQSTTKRIEEYIQTLAPDYQPIMSNQQQYTGRTHTIQSPRSITQRFEPTTTVASSASAGGSPIIRPVIPQLNAPVSTDTSRSSSRTMGGRLSHNSASTQSIGSGWRKAIGSPANSKDECIGGRSRQPSIINILRNPPTTNSTNNMATRSPRPQPTSSRHHQLQHTYSPTLSHSSSSSTINYPVSPTMAPVVPPLSLSHPSITAHHSISSPSSVPSQYDRYRDSLTTVRSLLESMSGSNKTHLFEDVNSFFFEKKKNETYEQTRLQVLENETNEKEDDVESSKRSIANTIKAKELKTIKVLNAYYNNLRKVHRKHLVVSKQQTSQLIQPPGGGVGVGSSSPIGVDPLDEDFKLVAGIFSGQFNSASTGSSSGSMDKSVSVPLGMSKDIDYMQFNPDERDEKDNSGPSNTHASNSFLSIPQLNHHSSTSPLHHSLSTSSASSSSLLNSTEAMEVLQEKLSSFGGEEALQIKLELLLSMLYAKLNEQAHILQFHEPLLQLREAFQEKLNVLLKELSLRHSAIQAESLLKQQQLIELKHVEERFLHLSHFDSPDSMFASVQSERQASIRAREEKEESYLSSLHADRHAMDEHVKDLEKQHTDLNIRIKRLDSELAHVQKLRETDRAKMKLIERKMKKELIMVLHGSIPQNLQKDLQQEYEVQLAKQRTHERLERSEPIRMAQEQKLNNQHTDQLLNSLTNGSTNESQPSPKSLSTVNANPDSGDQSSDTGDDSDQESKEKEDSELSADSSHHRRASLKRALSDKMNHSKDPSSHSQQPRHRPTGSSLIRPANSHRRGASVSSVSNLSRPSTHRSRGSPTPQSTPPPQPPAPQLILNSNGLPEALVQLRDGVAEMNAFRLTLLESIEDELKQMAELGIPLEEQGEEVNTSIAGSQRKRRAGGSTDLDSLKEGSEETETKGHGHHQRKSSVGSQPKRKNKRRSLRGSIMEANLNTASSNTLSVNTKDTPKSSRKRSESISVTKSPRHRSISEQPTMKDDSIHPTNSHAVASIPESTADSTLTSTSSHKKTASSSNGPTSSSKKKTAKSKKDKKKDTASKKTASTSHPSNHSKHPSNPSIATHRSAATTTTSNSIPDDDSPKHAIPTDSSQLNAANLNTAIKAAIHAQQSSERRLSFETRYAALLARPDVQNTLTDPVHPSLVDEVIMDIDPVTGRINGAFSKKEMKAQTLRFKAVIRDLETERQKMLVEIEKLEAVHPKLAASEARADELAIDRQAVTEELATLMSQLATLQFDAEAHGLVIGNENYTTDDIAEHTIWFEDGFRGEAHIPRLEAEDCWSPEWAMEEQKRQLDQLDQQRKLQERLKRLEEVKLKSPNSRRSTQKRSSLVGQPQIDTLMSGGGTASHPISPAVSPRGTMKSKLNFFVHSPKNSTSSSTSATTAIPTDSNTSVDAVPSSTDPSGPILSPAELLAVEAELLEDEMEEADELQIARDQWEEELRKKYDEQQQSALQARTARFNNKIIKLQAQLEVTREPSTEADIIREKIEKHQMKIDAIMKLYEEEFIQFMKQSEPKWLDEWELGKSQRQARRKESRIETKRLEAIAKRAETLRLKKEKRAAQGGGIGLKRGMSKTKAIQQLQSSVGSNSNSSLNSPASLSPRSSGPLPLQRASTMSNLFSKSTRKLHVYDEPKTKGVAPVKNDPFIPLVIKQVTSENKSSTQEATEPTVTQVTPTRVTPTVVTEIITGPPLTDRILVGNPAGFTITEPNLSIRVSHPSGDSEHPSGDSDSDDDESDDNTDHEASTSGGMDDYIFSSAAEAAASLGPQTNEFLVPVPDEYRSLHQEQSRLLQTKNELTSKIEALKQKLAANNTSTNQTSGSIRSPTSEQPSTLTSPNHRTTPAASSSSYVQSQIPVSEQLTVHEWKVDSSIAGPLSIDSSPQSAAVRMLHEDLVQQLQAARPQQQQPEEEHKEEFISPQPQPEPLLGSPPVDPSTHHLPLLPATTEYLNSDPATQLKKQYQPNYLKTYRGRSRSPTLSTNQVQSSRKSSTILIMPNPPIHHTYKLIDDDQLDSNPDSISAPIGSATAGVLTAQHRDARRQQQVLADFLRQREVGGGGRHKHHRELSILGHAPNVKSSQQFENESLPFDQMQTRKIANPPKLAMGFTAHGVSAIRPSVPHPNSTSTMDLLAALKASTLGPTKHTFSLPNLPVQQNNEPAIGQQQPESTPIPLHLPLIVNPSPFIRVTPADHRLSESAVHTSLPPVLHTMNFSSLLNELEQTAATGAASIPSHQRATSTNLRPNPVIPFESTKELPPSSSVATDTARVVEQDSKVAPPSIPIRSIHFVGSGASASSTISSPRGVMISVTKKNTPRAAHEERPQPTSSNQDAPSTSQPPLLLSPIVKDSSSTNASSRTAISFVGGLPSPDLLTFASAINLVQRPTPTTTTHSKSPRIQRTSNTHRAVTEADTTHEVATATGQVEEHQPLSSSTSAINLENSLNETESNFGLAIHGLQSGRRSGPSIVGGHSDRSPADGLIIQNSLKRSSLPSPPENSTDRTEPETSKQESKMDHLTLAQSIRRMEKQLKSTRFPAHRPHRSRSPLGRANSLLHLITPAAGMAMAESEQANAAAAEAAAIEARTGQISEPAGILDTPTTTSISQPPPILSTINLLASSIVPTSPTATTSTSTHDDSALPSPHHTSLPVTLTRHRPRSRHRSSSPTRTLSRSPERLPNENDLDHPLLVVSKSLTVLPIQLNTNGGSRTHQDQTTQDSIAK